MSILLLTMGPDLSITMDTPALRVGDPGTITLRAKGAVGQVKWVLAGTDLPAEWGGIVANGNEATISTDEALEWGTYTITVRAYDASRMPVVRTFQLSVAPAPIVITGSSSFVWVADEVASANFSITGGTGHYISASVHDGSLPATMNVSLAGSTVSINGTPSPSEVGTGNAALAVADDTGAMGLINLGWEVTAPPRWRYTTSLPLAYREGAEVVLPDGRVLIAGGQRTGETNSSACLLFDPVAQTFTATGSLVTAQRNGDAVLLDANRVLLANGTSSGGSTVAQIYDIAAGTWSLAASRINSYRFHKLARLPDGRVLLVPGTTFDTACEIYDPVANTWTAAPAIPYAQAGVSLGTLQDGRIIAVGRNSVSSNTAKPIFDAATGTWSTTATLSGNHHEYGAVQVLPSGKVLAVAGIAGSTSSVAHIFDPSTNAWTATASAPYAARYLGSAVLASGKVIIAGGIGSSGSARYADSAIYDAATGTWEVAPTLNTGRSHIQLHRLQDGSVIVFGGSGDGNSILSTCEVYR